MSISSELLTLQNTKTAIRTAINNKGGSVGASDTFASYATAIDNLPSGGGNKLLTSIDVSDFSGTTFNEVATYITDVTIPSGVTSIGTYAFKSCSSLTSIGIPNSVTSIGQYAFYDCHSLVSITIPSGATTIGDHAFNGCRGLTSLIVNATTPPTLSNANAFNNTNNCPIYVPSESVAAYKAATNWSTYESRIYPIQQVATVDGNPVYNYEIGATGQVTEMTSAMLAALPTGNSVKFSDGIDTFSGQIGAYEQVTLPASGLTQLEFTVASPINAATETLTVPFNALLPNIVVANDTLGGAGLTEIILDTDMCGVPYSSAVDALKATAGFTTFADIIKAKPEDYMVITNLDVDPAPNGVITMSLAHAEQDTESQSPDALICYAPFTICKPSFAVDGETSNGTYTDSRGRTATYTPSLGSANIYNGDTLIASDMSIEVDNSGIGQDWDSANDMWSIMVYTDSSGSGTDVVTLQPGMRVECFIDEIKYDYDSEASCTPMAHSYITINVTA